MSRRTVVYLAGPYTVGEPEDNVEFAIDVAEVLLEHGYAPVIPHLSHHWQMRHPHDYDEWMDLDLTILERCDAVLRMSGRSPGADTEVEAALDLDIPVFWNVAALMSALPASRPTKPDRGPLPSSVAEAIERATAVFVAKNADYAEDISWRSNFDDIASQMGVDAVTAADTMIAVKQARLRSLQSNARDPQNESVADTYLDRMVYSVIAYALLLES